MTPAVAAPGSNGRTAASAPGATASDMLDALWAQVVGQPQLVEDLRTAAGDPVQAYLLVGPEGSGKRAAATAFAAEVVAGGLDEEAARRSVSLTGSDVHPSVHFVERVGTSILVDEARDLVTAASRAPSEGSIQVFILDEFHLVGPAAPTLLKAIEEPERGTLFVVLAEEVTEGLVTIASRCVQHALAPVSVDAVSNQLVIEGIEPAVALEAARSAEGSLRRARLLAGDTGLVARRDAWSCAPARLDGTGATLCVVADELLELIEGVLQPITAKHEEEVAAFEEMVEMTGDKATGRRDAMEKRHKREARRLRTGELISGALALLGSYRSSVTEDAGVSTETYLRAASAVQQFTDAIRSNANEPLALRALLLQLDTRSEIHRGGG